MINFFLSMILLCSGKTLETGIFGTWKYIGFVYEEHFYTPLDPEMDLRFEVHSDFTTILKWYTNGHFAFCERKATFRISQEGWLYQKVVWVNPDNESSCAKDPDMQLGRETTTIYEIKSLAREDQLLLHLSVSDKPLVYILKRIAE